MALTFGFFNSVNSDRTYNAIQISSIFDGIIEDGIFASIGDAFQVLSTTGLGITVGTGRAWFDHTWTYNDAPIPIVLDSSDPILPRYDAIVLETDSSIEVRANTIKKVTGTPATIPTYPILENSEYVHQYPFAYILVNGGAVSINQASITNMIGQSACPYVIGPLAVVSTNDLVAQWEEEFNLWFAEMQDQLSEEAAGNLQLQINNHNHGEPTNTPVVTAGIDNGAITTEKLADGAITIDKLALSSVDDSKIQYRVPKLTHRQGASANHWNDAEGGVLNISLTNVKIAVGVKALMINNGANFGTQTIDFPSSFEYTPLIYFNGYEPSGADFTLRVTANSPSQGTIRANRPGTSGTLQIDIYWLAIGPGY